MDKQIFLLNITIDELIDKTSDKILQKIKEIIPQSKTEEELLTCRQAAALLQISLPTLHAYSKTGVIPSYRFGRNIRYKKSELEGIIDKGLRFKIKTRIQ